MTEVFCYLVTGLSGESLVSTLETEVFPQIEILRRNVRSTRHQLRELGTRSGRTRYLWEIHVDLVAGTTEPPAASELQAILGALGTVLGPVARATVDADLRQVHFAAKLMKVTIGEPLAWCFLGVPPGFMPQVDFIGFRPAGDDLDELRPSFEPPFAELTLGSSIVTGEATGPAGCYWFTASLIPGRQTGKQEILRLDCDPESCFDEKPGAGIELDNPPARGG